MLRCNASCAYQEDGWCLHTSPVIEQSGTEELLRCKTMVSMVACELCFDEFIPDEIVETRQGSVCVYCYHDEYKPCERCGEVCWIEDEMYGDLCHKCAQEAEAEEILFWQCLSVK